MPKSSLGITIQTRRLPTFTGAMVSLANKRNKNSASSTSRFITRKMLLIQAKEVSTRFARM